MRSLLLVLFLGLVISLYGQTPLVGNKDGRWIIFQGAHRVELPESYYDVGMLDQLGITHFAEKGKYGLLNTQGDVIVPAQYGRMESLGYGTFGVLSEGSNYILRYDDGIVTMDSCLRWEKEDSHWIQVFCADGMKVVNLPSGKTWSLSSGIFLSDIQYGYAQLIENGSEILYDYKGDSIALGGGSVEFNLDYVRIRTKEYDRLVMEHKTFELPLGVLSLSITSEMIQFTMDKRTVYWDFHGNSILDVPYQSITMCRDGMYIVQNNFLKGIMSNNGEELCPLRYRELVSYGEYFVATDDNGTGLIRPDGTVLIPLKYNSVIRKGPFFEVRSNINRVGLYSISDRRMILEPVYNNISISRDRVRAWLGNKLRILTYDENTKITDDFTLTNTLSKFQALKNSKRVDTRLYSLGWFDESIPIVDNEGFTIGSKVKWGLKNDEDSVLIEPRFNAPLFVPEMKFSLIQIGFYSEYWGGVDLNNVKQYMAFDVNKARPMAVDPIISIDSTDGIVKDYVRYTSTNGMGYITKDNIIHPLTYMDIENESIIRVAKSKSNTFVGVENKSFEGVQLFYYGIGEEEKRYRNVEFKGKSYSKVVYPDAEWNFLAKNGELLFPEPFEYVAPFKYGTSIVKRNGVWGLCNKDSIILPIKYSEVKRLKEFDDTVFRVQLVPTGMRFMDTLSNPLEVSITRVSKSTPSFAIVQSGRKVLVLDNNYEVVSEEANSYRLLSDKAYYQRDRKEYHIYNEDGRRLMTTNTKPIDILHDQLVVFKDGSKYGLLDSYGDTLYDGRFKFIGEVGDYVLLDSGEEQILLDSDGNWLTAEKKDMILVDPITGNYAACNGQRAIIYSLKGDKITKVKAKTPTQFVNNALIRTGRESFVIPIDEAERTFPSSFDEVILADGNGTILVVDDSMYYYDLNWEPFNNGNSFPRAKYLGNGILVSRNDSTNLLFSPQMIKHFSRNARFDKKGFCDGLVRVDEDGKSYFINRDMEDAFNREFDDASTFVNGYTAVKVTGGWTIMDKKGYQKSIGAFDKITPDGNNIFSTSKKPLYGLYTASGIEILPPEFEKISFPDEHVIQGIREGEIFYFTRSGEPLIY